MMESQRKQSVYLLTKLEKKYNNWKLLNELKILYILNMIFRTQSKNLYYKT